MYRKAQEIYPLKFHHQYPFKKKKSIAEQIYRKNQSLWNRKVRLLITIELFYPSGYYFN